MAVPQFSEDEAAQILSEAARTQGSSRGLTRDELVAAAAEAGISAEAVDQAIIARLRGAPREITSHGSGNQGRAPYAFLPNPTYKVADAAEAAAPTRSSIAELEDAVRLFREAGLQHVFADQSSVTARGIIGGAMVNASLGHVDGETRARVSVKNHWLIPVNLLVSWMLGTLLALSIVRGPGSPLDPSILVCGSVVFCLIHHVMMSIPMKRARFILESLTRPRG